MLSTSILLSGLLFGFAFVLAPALGIDSEALRVVGVAGAGDAVLRRPGGSDGPDGAPPPLWPRCGGRGGRHPDLQRVRPRRRRCRPRRIQPLRGGARRRPRKHGRGLGSAEVRAPAGAAPGPAAPDDQVRGEGHARPWHQHRPGSRLRGGAHRGRRLGGSRLLRDGQAPVLVSDRAHRRDRARLLPGALAQQRPAREPRRRCGSLRDHRRRSAPGTGRRRGTAADRGRSRRHVDADLRRRARRLARDDGRRGRQRDDGRVLAGEGRGGSRRCRVGHRNRARVDPRGGPHRARWARPASASPSPSRTLGAMVALATADTPHPQAFPLPGLEDVADLRARRARRPACGRRADA